MRETEILVEQQPPQGVLVCDHAGLVINAFSLSSEFWPKTPQGVLLRGHAGLVINKLSVYSLLQQQVVCERNPDPSSTSTPAGGLSTGVPRS